MLRDVAVLLEIQVIDKERLELNEQLRSYPVMWEELKRKRDKCERELKQALQATQDFHSTRSRLEQEIKIGKDLLKRYESQISLMRTQREVSAISTQIDQTKMRVSKIEEECEALKTREEQIKADQERTKAAFDQVVAEMEEERDRIRAQIRTKKEKLAETEKTRKRIVTKVDQDLLTSYDRLMRRWPGSSVVSVHNGSCTGCHFAVLPMKMVEIHREREIVYCDNCGRMFSHDEDFKPEESPAASAE